MSHGPNFNPIRYFFQILKNPEADIFVTQWEGKSCGTSKNFPATVANSVSNLFSASVSVSASVSLRAEPIFSKTRTLSITEEEEKTFFASDLKNFVSKIELTIFNSSLWSLFPQFFSGEEEEDWNHEVDSFRLHCHLAWVSVVLQLDILTFLFPIDSRWN